MQIIALKTYTSYEVLPKVQRLVNENNWKFKEIFITYNTRFLPNYDDVETYPVTIIFEKNGEQYAVKIPSLSVGYNGSGPTDLLELLSYFELEFEKNDITTKQKMGNDYFIRLHYQK